MIINVFKMMVVQWVTTLVGYLAGCEIVFFFVFFGGRGDHHVFNLKLHLVIFQSF